MGCQDRKRFFYAKTYHITLPFIQSHHIFPHRLQIQQPSFPEKVLRIIKTWLAWELENGYISATGCLIKATRGEEGTLLILSHLIDKGKC